MALVAGAALSLAALAVPRNASLADVRERNLHIHFCTEPEACDAWALGRPGATSAMMPQSCREQPQPDDVQAIAVSFANSAAAREEGDLILVCGETAEGVAEIRAFRADPFVPPLAAEAMATTDCALVSLAGPVQQRHRDLRRLYSGLPMCGFDALQVPHRQAPPRPLGPLRRLPARAKDEIVDMVSEEVYMRELRLLTGAEPITLPSGEPYSIATRNTNQADNLISADHIAKFFEDCGLENVQLQEFTCCGGTSARNVVARQVGTEFPDEIVVVGAHFDTLPSGDTAPGAQQEPQAARSLPSIPSA